MERLIGSHKVKADDGTIHEVLELQEIINAGTFDNPNAIIPGLKRFALRAGGPVNFVDENTFKIVMTGKTVRRV
jgi:hypothetical protein